MDFSLVAAALMASSGNATSISLRGDLMGWGCVKEESPPGIDESLLRRETLKRGSSDSVRSG
jgi:hypothetical protein